MTGAPLVNSAPALPVPLQPPLPTWPIVGPGVTEPLVLVPMSVETTPRWRFGSPPGSELRLAIRFGKLLTKLACLSAIDAESSITNSRSSSRFGVTGTSTTVVRGSMAASGAASIAASAGVAGGSLHPLAHRSDMMVLATPSFLDIGLSYAARARTGAAAGRVGLMAATVKRW